MDAGGSQDRVQPVSDVRMREGDAVREGEEGARRIPTDMEIDREGGDRAQRTVSAREEKMAAT